MWAAAAGDDLSPNAGAGAFLLPAGKHASDARAFIDHFVMWHMHGSLPDKPLMENRVEFTVKLNRVF